MNQLNIMGPKRRLTNLHLQPSYLNSTYKRPEANRPGTPYPMPTNRWKRSASFIGQDDAPKNEETKKRKTTNNSLVSFPSLDSEHPPSNISPMKLTWALRSILNQVDWSEVALDVVGNEKPTIYRNAFKKLIQAHIEEVLRQDGYREDRPIKQGKREEEDTPGMEYMKCPDTDSKDDNSDNGTRNGSKSLDDRSFVVIDEEDEYESDGYENDEEKDTDDEDQEDKDEDEDYQDGLSV